MYYIKANFVEFCKAKRDIFEISPIKDTFKTIFQRDIS